MPLMLVLQVIMVDLCAEEIDKIKNMVNVTQVGWISFFYDGAVYGYTEFNYI